MNLNTLRVRKVEVMLSEKYQELEEVTKHMDRHETRDTCLEVLKLVMEEYTLLYTDMLAQKEMYDDLVMKSWGL